jgi:hypothetical protein
MARSPVRLRCRKPRAALLALLIGVAGALPADATEKRRGLDVAALLPRLPVEIFDNTTEGIDEDELKLLRIRGQSENWRISARTARKLVFTAKRPYSEVTLRPVQDGLEAFVEALTFNEKAISYSYWVPKAASGPLEAHEPSALFRLFNEREDGRPGVAVKDAPAAIVAHARLRERCAQARKQAAPSTPDCEGLAAKAATLGQQFAAEPRWIAIIDRIPKVIGD